WKGLLFQTRCSDRTDSKNPLSSPNRPGAKKTLPSNWQLAVAKTSDLCKSRSLSQPSHGKGTQVQCGRTCDFGFLHGRHHESDRQSSCGQQAPAEFQRGESNDRGSSREVARCVALALGFEHEPAAGHALIDSRFRETG